MAEGDKVDAKEVGLDIGLAFARYLLGTDHLHYGYWDDGLEVNVRNLPEAQEKYCDLLLSHVPEGVRTVLDVGCGSGRFAEKLMDLGYEVDCVSPSPFLSEQAKKAMGGRGRVFECRYEELQTDGRYDLVLFSESFQYVELEESLEITCRLLNERGHLLISDFFRTEAKGKCYIGGGHDLSRFRDVVSRHPLELVEDIDITRKVAPNMDLLGDAFLYVLRPTWHSVLRFLDSNHPIVSRLLRWRFKKKMCKISTKYFSGVIGGEHFSIFKTYRLMLYEKTPLRHRKSTAQAK